MKTINYNKAKSLKESLEKEHKSFKEEKWVEQNYCEYKDGVYKAALNGLDEYIKLCEEYPEEM